MIIEKILQIAPSGTRIPKPNAKADFIVKGVGKRRNEDALIYLIPNHQNSNRPYPKGVTFSEFEKAYTRLQTSGEFTREWFDENLPECSNEGGCNFTTIGGIFQLLNIADYSGAGCYKRIRTQKIFSQWDIVKLIIPLLNKVVMFFRKVRKPIHVI